MVERKAEVLDSKFKLWSEVVDLPNNRRHVRKLKNVTLRQLYPHHCIVIETRANKEEKERIVCYRDLRGKITIQKDDGKGNLVHLQRHEIDNIGRLVRDAARKQKADGYYLSKTKKFLRHIGFKTPKFLR